MTYKMKAYLSGAAVLIMLASGCAHKEVRQSEETVDTAVSVEEKKTDVVSSGVDRARDAVLVYFTPLNGSIEDIEDGRVKIKLNEEGLAKKGMRFSVFREGAPFFHPVTNELIGRAEDLVGRVEVESEYAVEGSYICRIINGEITAGDKIRISSSSLKLAFFQDRKANWSVSEAFYSALKDSGRFDIAEAYAKDYRTDSVLKLAKDLGAEAALMFSTPVKDGDLMLNIKLYWVEDASMLGEINEKIGHGDTGIGRPDEEFILMTLKDTKPWRRFPIPKGRLIATGDVDGNGVGDFVVSNGRDISIYSIKDEFRELWNIKAENEGTHLSIDVLDLNNNGRAEIFVTSAINAAVIDTDGAKLFPDEVKLNSFVMEYDPAEGYKIIEGDIPYFLRVTGNTLLMQQFNSARIYSGPVYKAKWDGLHYKPEEPLNLPEAANIYGFAYVDWRNEGLAEVMTFDNNGYLNLYDTNGNLKWRSDRSYGPFVFTFETKTRSMVNPTVKWSVRGRLEVVNTGRGQEVVAVSRKPVVAGVPGLGVSEANVYSLWWDGGVMDEKLVLGEVSGAVTDYLVQGSELFVLAAGDLFTFIRSAAQGEFAKGSILYYYNFTPPGDNP